MTREEKIIKTLEAMNRNSFKLAVIYRERGEEAKYQEMMIDVLALENAISLITDDVYLDNMAKNFNVE